MGLDQAYAECGRITRREAKNFAWGIMLLPRPKRLGLTALYAYARRVDDVADGAADAASRRADLLAIRAALRALPDVPADDPVLTAVADTVARYDVPLQALDDLVEGGLWDVERTRYADWAELREYCRLVAGSVGVACTAVYGPPGRERAFPLAEQLGLALQQINIMRDVAEDWRLGRVYLPQDEMARYGVSDDDLAEGRMTAGWRGLMAHQGARARALLAEGMALCALLDARSALCVRTLAGIYAGLLDEIERRRYDVFTARPSLSALGKLRVIGGGILREAA